MSFTPADLGRVRFAVSPIWETVSAVRVVTGPQGPGPHGPWPGRVARGLDLRLLALLLPRYGYTPDFITPPPGSRAPTIDDELARVAATPPDVVHEEILRALAETPGASHTPTGRLLMADPAKVLVLLVEKIADAWRTLVRPHWGRVRALLDADIAVRATDLAEGGLDGLFGRLHPLLHWRDGVLTRERGDDEHRDLGGEGLLLMPSAFKWDQVIVILDEPWQPTLVYPARGLGTLWEPPRGGAALGRLIGRTRAALLTGLGEPASTTALAHRFALAPATVSQHLAVLRDAGMVAGRRHGHEVRYRRTELGEAVAESAS
ncbi:ArsR family transcriptional regulator [Actinorhabdospora filicis]|uniref:ArsR family transcriptional regulator n=1 Tax=Actinorhabdospora filicis TaxID=1785913 RepID=A0A9W6SN25_9ACTN|nr:DUF5937 family protein [Actinorhabdospora filicis]GLZ77591.1 ArsR family transcriptional regulator [Actinorhabdospora filicis]